MAIVPCGSERDPWSRPGRKHRAAVESDGRSLRKALKALGAYRKLLGPKKARRTLANSALDGLGAQVPGLQADLKTLVAAATR
jgi:hypothetical protein